MKMTENGGGQIENVKILSPQKLKELKYDVVYIGIQNYYFETLELLKKWGIPHRKIDGRYVEPIVLPRIESLKSVKILLDEDGITEGSVAELGVYRGAFAGEINKVFPSSKLYLFDTFEGFVEEDYQVEVKKGYAQEKKTGFFGNTTVQIVLDKMLYPERCCICKGFFPDTAKNIDDMFKFVNLDADLYAPTLAGLEFFYPRLVKGGVIFVHDYFSKAYPGVKAAVKEFCTKENISYMPIGDTLSIAIRK